MMAFAIDPQHGFNPSLFAQYLAEHVYQIDTFGVPNFGYGINTMRAARNLYSGVVWNRSGLNHSTCSPAIRMSPLGLYFHSDFDALEEAAVVAGNITHANHIAVAGGVAVALAVAKLVAGSGQFESSSLMDWLQPEVAAHDEELADKLELAAGLAADAAVSDEQAYERLGNSSETREIVPLAFYAFLRTPHDYEETVLRAINAGGDADSAGSIAGSLSGALNGVSAIPETWIHHLRNRSLVYRAIGHLGAFV